MNGRPEVLFLGGRAGVGKTSVALELHTQLAAARVRHCLVEGDNLDQAWPTPWEQGLRLAEQNLTAIWGNYRSAGYSRLIYTNTAAVRSDVMGNLLAALGGDPVVTAVLLTATDETAASRLGQREIGSGLDAHLERSRLAAAILEAAAPDWVHRIATDGLAITETAQSIRSMLGWVTLDNDVSL